MNKFPRYLATLEKGLYKEKLIRAQSMLQKCNVCPRTCKVNRINDELGECKAGFEPIISSYFPHFGEERPLVGSRGSGTIFIAGCNLQCLFCQNYETSHLCEGKPVSIEQFSSMMLELQRLGCHNINIVTPSHIVPQLIEAVFLAATNGLRLPLVYNSSGYDALASLRLLEGVVDIYMPDLKFFNNELAARYTTVSDYSHISRKAIKEMHRQVGDLVIEDGIAKKGLLVRHLVMPGLGEDSKKILQFIANEISLNTYLNIMPQYRPAGEAHRYPEISHSLPYSEFIAAIEYARSLGMSRLDKEY
jgi:putative pyruvate formate lyase activating enzyme